MTQDFDLAAYLERIGIKEHVPAADIDGLTVVQRAHRLTIPFENIDVKLGRGVSLDPAHVFDKLVVRRRGGYCFEQNSLFLRALLALGFDARPLLGRVWFMSEGGVPPRNHLLNLVQLDGKAWIADAGFGGIFTPPMLLADGSEVVAPDGSSFRLSTHPDHGWMLERQGDPAADWVQQYSFTLDTIFPADLEVANHWTSTRPGTLFTTITMVSVCLPTGAATLMDRHYTRRNATEQVESDIESAKAYRLRLNFVFGIIVDEVEVMGLGLY